jgi:hypothetical protein
MFTRVFRRRPPVSLAVSMLALFVALSGWGYAATGGSFLLGRSNSAGKTTSLSSTTKAGPSLSVRNRGGKPAASFSVNDGVPPFSVNSTGKVDSLNADLLDGNDSSAFQTRVSGTCPDGSAIRVVNDDGTVVCSSAGGGTTTDAWSLKGNAGTAAGTDFLGTTDSQPLVVKTNGSEALRVDTDGKVGVGTTGPAARVDSAGGSGIAVMGTSDTRGVIGRLGTISCPGTYGVGGCAGATGADGVFGSSDTGVGVDGRSVGGRAVQGFSDNGIGVIGDSTTRGVIGTLNRGSCPGTYAVGGCAGGAGDGVVGVSGVGPNSFTAAAVRARNSAGGDVFLGEVGTGNNISRVARIDGTGRGFFNNGTQSGGADYAESLPAVDAASLKPGDVLAIDPASGFAVGKSRAAASPLVVGVYSTKPAVLAVGRHGVTDSLAGEVPVAMVGIVPTKVTAANGPIRAGDLLTASSLAGYAMKARPLVVHGMRIYPTGAILGKALQPLKSGKGVIQVLLMLR